MFGRSMLPIQRILERFRLIAIPDPWRAGLVGLKAKD